MNNINFLKTTVSLLGSKDPQLIKDGISNEDLETIQDKLQVIIEANAFIAWVREAIKAKDDEITAVKSMSVESYYSDVLQLGVMDSELMYPKEIKDSDILANWNIKERNEYFGKYVAEKPINIDAVANKVKELEKEYNLYLANLKVLGDAVDVEKKADEAEKLTAQVSTMTGEQLAVLKAAIKATEIQQQN